MRAIKSLFTIVALLICSVLHAQSIIPTPRLFCEGNGCYTITENSAITANEELKPVAYYLALHTGVEVSEHGDIRLAIHSELDREEYRLTINTDGVLIEGGGYGGVFNGVVTLLQLLPSEVYSKKLTLPTSVSHCKVEDKPRFSHRGFMLDPCRTWVTKEAILEYIDLLAYHKINSLRLHLTDDEAWRIEIKSHPELAEIGGYRGGDSPIWSRYGKWNEKWGGYYSQEDIREIIAYARIRNMEVVPEIDLPGHSLCIATLHPEILCGYTPNLASSFGYDTRSAFCPSKEENYALLQDIITEVCGLFDSEYIHIGGDEVDMSQWRNCPDCQKFMLDNKMTSTDQLQVYFMSRIADMVKACGKQSAVWNEAIEGGTLDASTRVYGWEGIKECRMAAAKGYHTVVIPGQYFYFDMKQSSREPGHDWAAIFDAEKVYNFTLASVGFTAEEQEHVIGLESTFFSEAYASRNPETAVYLHYQTFPRMLAFAEVAWICCDDRCWDRFYLNMVDHYDRMDSMGIAYRLVPPVVEYCEGMLSAKCDDGSAIYYKREPMTVEMLYTEPIKTDKPVEYSFVSRRGRAVSPEAAVALHFKNITPKFTITSSMPDRANFSYEKAQGYGRLARTARAGDIGDWVMFTFGTPVKCRRMKVATGNFQLPRYIFENGYVEVSYNGVDFERVGELQCGMYYIEYPPRAIKAVRIVCTSQGNGASWVSIQPPTIWPML